MADFPRYLTSPGYAIAERNRWQRRMAEEMRFIVADRPGAQWTTMVRRFSREIEIFPEWAKNYLLLSTPDDPEESIEQMARTLGTAGYNDHVLRELAYEGIPLKMWVTRRDANVRLSHAEADRQKVPLSSPFLVDGVPMQFPADARTAPMDLWIGCRCTVVGRFR